MKNRFYIDIALMHDMGDEYTDWPVCDGNTDWHFRIASFANEEDAVAYCKWRNNACG